MAVLHKRFMTSLTAVDTQPTPSSIRSHSAGKRWGERKRQSEGKRTRTGGSQLGVRVGVWGGRQQSPLPSPYVFTQSVMSTLLEQSSSGGHARLDTLHLPSALSHKQDLISSFICSNWRRAKQCHCIVSFFSPRDPTGRESYTAEKTLTDAVYLLQEG